ncbi:MAG: flavin reductase family protein, partial [Bacillota bacterium]|nr:flavin reductase family protein [Bacillota bacterium]
MKRELKPEAILFPAPVLIIGTYDEKGEANAMNAAWGGVCSSTPPCVAVSIRESRKTYENICASCAFTVNFPGVQHLREADYFGIVSGKDEDKLEKTGLHTKRAEHVNAPYIEEFPLALECKVVKVVEIGSHKQVIGEITGILAEEEVLDEKGRPDVEKIKPLIFDTVASEYRCIGEPAGKAFHDGKVFMK